MSCRDGERCNEGRKRLRAWWVLGAMLVVFGVLSVFSFFGPRHVPQPSAFSFDNHSADAGKRVFQEYNCMDCHTLVGNGAYFAPDLTKEYNSTGPAWLAAFLPSAGHWPTEATLKVQLSDPAIAKAAGTDSLQAYYAKYPGAEERVKRRSGATVMPNLPLTHAEVEELIAYLDYTAALNTEGWPPRVESGDLAHRVALAHAAGITPAAAPSPVEQGKQLAMQYGCTACHSTGTERLVGPPWEGLYGSQVKLTDGSTATADDAFLTYMIVHPNIKVVAGYPKGVMPDFSAQLSTSDVAALVAYIRSLENKP